MPQPLARGARQAFTSSSSFLVQALHWREVNMACTLSAPGRADTLGGRTACLSLLLPDNQHTHTKRGTYTSPRMRVQRVLTPAKESAEKGMFLGEKAGGGAGQQEESSKPGGLLPRQ